MSFATVNCDILHLLIQYNFLQGGESYFKQWLSCHLYMLMLRWCTFCLSNIQGLRLTFQLVSPVASDRFDSLAETNFSLPRHQNFGTGAIKKHSFLSKYWFTIFTFAQIYDLSCNFIHFYTDNTVSLSRDLWFLWCHEGTPCGQVFFSVVPLLNQKGQDGRCNLWLP